MSLLLIVVANTLTMRSRQPEVILLQQDISIDSEKAAERLAQAIRLKTISYQEASDFIAEPFLQLIDLVAVTFPKVEQKLEKKVINRYSLLYRWRGKNPELKPLIFLAHLDVVPPDPKTAGQWQYPPFSGAIEDGYIWGRGTLDDKSSVFGVLEAVEYLIAQGFVPDRSIYLAFGHDEEIGGKQGAAKIAQYLKHQGVNALFTLDEGMVIVDEQLSPAQKMTGIIGVAEKGYVTLELNAKVAGGHSSMPAKESAVGALAKAVLALEENQMKPSLTGVSGELFEFLGPEMNGVKKLLFANRWLFDAVIMSVLLEKKSTAAMIRTTTAVTLLNAGVKENVLPAEASALVNFRILPENTSNDVLQHARTVVNNQAVTIQIVNNGMLKEASKISATDSFAFTQIGKTIQQIFKGALIAPGLVLAGTDSVHYEALSENSYRFAPYTFGPEDLSRVHGVNERIGIEDYRQMIQFYAQLILNLD